MINNHTSEDILALAEAVWEEVGHHFDRRPRLDVHQRPTKWRLGSTRTDCLEARILLAGARLVDWDPTGIEDVIRHEYAHALHWQLDGTIDHSPRWRHYATLLGARPRATGSLEMRLAYAATGTL